MIEVTTGSNYKEVEKALKKTLNKSSTALSNAINRAATTAQATMKNSSQGVPSMYRIKSNETQKAIKIKRANRNDLIAVVKVRGRTRPLYGFAVSPKTRVRSSGKSIRPGRYKAAIYKSRRMEPLDKTENKPFVTRTKSGVMGVFSRMNKSNPDNLIEKNVRVFKKNKNKVKSYRYKVTKEKLQMHFGPSIPQMVDNTEIMFRLRKGIRNTLEKRLDHELNQIIRRNMP